VPTPFIEILFQIQISYKAFAILAHDNNDIGNNGVGVIQLMKFIGLQDRDPFSGKGGDVVMLRLMVQRPALWCWTPAR
jgi:hypothetical protein